ncbi:hypothetical protein SPAB_03330 [Salmonella enterica subsp. enterica serovar Paratyphi B str. SPB7]|uniref:Uncharacterized protein n=1 Tax=Salmonella paratyphi B (strain ATCC BAA-1250 / SPB7) TaxID=1016998 RepID=A0A6C6Z4I1_SALPB|nr:hypothetical protein SPAB_03330 [Salmonella enterica subsp. enterica serovar Paratyphi B str. SPB7]
MSSYRQLLNPLKNNHNREFYHEYIQYASDDLSGGYRHSAGIRLRQQGRCWREGDCPV